MQVIRAPRYAGFCGGVKRAWKLALQELDQAGDQPVYLSGKLIHNAPALHELEAMGLRLIQLHTPAAPRQGTLIVRAHGEGPHLYQRANELGLRTVDATCSIVKAVQRRARALEQQGYQVVLFGHKNHPEALATIAYTERGILIESAAEARALDHFPRIAAIAQTTAAQWEYEAVCAVLRDKCDEFEDQGRICGWTLSAQSEAAKIAEQVEVMVVIGGRDSSNTHRLVEVCSRYCPAYHVETADELQPDWFAGVKVVGVTAGASTRDRDIDAVVTWLERHGAPAPRAEPASEIQATAALLAMLDLTSTTADEAEEEDALSLIERRKTRQVIVGGVPVGGDAPIRVQSMCDTDTRDVRATVDQILRLEEAGCELIRVAVPDMAAAAVLGKIKSRIHIPLVADIHFNYLLALASIDEGVDKVRINPGNIFVKAGQKGIEAVIARAKEARIPLRIGVNSGSIEPRLLDKYGYPTAEAAVESALDHIRFCEELDFTDIIISVKFSEVPTMIRAYELLAREVDYPLHLGVTEAGTPWSGTIKSAIGIGALLAQGIGDTIRVSLTTPDKTEEVRVAYEILKSLEIRAHGPMLTACPGCGRTEVDLLKLTAQVEEALKGVKTSLRVAVMGCVVNGPGEAAEADLAVVGGRGRGAIYRRGKLLRTANEADLVTVLLEELAKWEANPEPPPAPKRREVIPLSARRR